MTKVNKKGLTERYTHPQVVTLAVYRLGGENRFVDTEDVAKQAAALAPGRFAWRKYPDQINLELVRVYLSDAKKTEHGALLDGSGKRGWILTVSGLRWVREADAVVGEASLARDPRRAQGGSVTTNRQARERERLLQTAAWKKWSEGASGSIGVGDACEVFRIDNYSMGDLRRLKVDRLRKMFADDPDLEKFFQHLVNALTGAEHTHG